MEVRNKRNNGEEYPLKNIQIADISKAYSVRRLGEDDVDLILALCRENTLYAEYCGKAIDRELIEHDIRVTPPGIPMEQKYYIGFFEGNKLAAVMDLIDGFPDSGCAFIGFFMMNIALQGRGIGSSIILEVLSCLKGLGFERCRLGIDKGNPQSNHFWKKNGFEVIREVALESGAVLLAERQL